MSVYFRQHQVETAFSNGSESWVVLSQIEKQIKEKIEKVGTPLKDWDIQINYGIKTGFNEAFIIDGKKRQELIEQDPKSDEIIRPILRGRDIKRYSYDFADLWLINTHNGIRSKGVKPIDINDYPAVKQHLDNYYPQLERRQDKGDTPYNLRNCAYIEDFYKQKIVYSNMCSEQSFVLEKEKYVTNQKCFILVGSSLEFLVTFFNSKLFKFAFWDNFPKLGDKGRELSKIFMEKIPILKPDKFIENRISEFLLKDNYTEIDKLIYSIYDLTEEEIKFIENREC